MKRIGVLTGGGDCPGLNAVIRAVTRKALQHDYAVMGFNNGWLGLVENDAMILDYTTVSGILPRGGTILGTSRTNPFQAPAQLQQVLDSCRQRQLTGLIAIGGEDTLGVANKLFQQYQLPIVGVPKTIDNDLSGTEVTFGFDTAVNTAMEAIDRLHTTAESHHRIMVVEVMGRHAGWIALHAGLAGGGDVILIPEVPIDLNDVCEILNQRQRRGKSFSIVVVAEGAAFRDAAVTTSTEQRDAFGHARLGGIGQRLGAAIEETTGIETRVTVLGHVQRGGSPTAFDRVLATRYGVKAIELVLEGRFGQMVSLRANQMVAVPLDVVTTLKTVDDAFYDVAKVFFG